MITTVRFASLAMNQPVPAGLIIGGLKATISQLT
jgi:hypothetical protein